MCQSNQIYQVVFKITVNLAMLQLKCLSKESEMEDDGQEEENGNEEEQEIVRASGYFCRRNCYKRLKFLPVHSRPRLDNIILHLPGISENKLHSHDFVK